MAIFIPATMMTQHPDSASRYISVRDEPKEAIDALTPQPVGLGLQEVMVDYEGKLTPYHQTAEIALGVLERGLEIGRDVLITPRIPSAGKETVFHQLMALMSIVECNYKLAAAGSKGSIGEVIVPMVGTAGELIDVRERIQDVVDLGHKEFGISRDPDAIQLIPLVEEVPELLCAGNVMQEYIDRAEQKGYRVKRLRIMLGRSDSAMVYGMVPSVLAVKAAMSDCQAVADANNVGLFPIFGGGALPFRGHVTLDNFKMLCSDYAGMRTITVQSGVRYDSGSETARQLALEASKSLRDSPVASFSARQRAELTAWIGIFTKHYLESFAKLMPMVISLGDIIPPQRDRLARKSAVGYARDAAQPQKLAREIDDREISKELEEIEPFAARNLPRAISFTGALYSIGLPPEFIGVGRGLAEISERLGPESAERFLKTYKGLPFDLAKAARYTNLETAFIHLPGELRGEIEKDIEEVSARLDVKIGPASDDDRRYHLLLETVQPMLRQLASGEEWGGKAADKDLVIEWICRLGRLRGSLG